MPKAIFVGDIVEDNGRTWRENALLLSHKYPIGALVEVKYDNWQGNGAGIKVHARLFVVWHLRDCDGTPLYHLANTPGDRWGVIDGSSATLWRDVSPEDIFAEGARGYGILSERLKGMYNIVHCMGEDDMTQIELTDAVIKGEDLLTWETAEKD